MIIKLVILFTIFTSLSYGQMDTAYYHIRCDIIYYDEGWRSDTAAVDFVYFTDSLVITIKEDSVKKRSLWLYSIDKGLELYQIPINFITKTGTGVLIYIEGYNVIVNSPLLRCEARIIHRAYFYLDSEFKKQLKIEKIKYVLP